MFCREQAARIKEIYPQIKATGVQVIAIGNGTYFMAQDFVEQFDIPFPIYTDEKRTTYQMMNLNRGLGIGIGTIKAGLALTKKGTRQGHNQGDVWQQGGEALFAKGGELLWKHANRTAEQHTTPKEILKVLTVHSTRLK